jgi:hypothetical protein
MEPISSGLQVARDYRHAIIHQRESFRSVTLERVAYLIVDSVV